ncbi:hypothetical protein DPEC_G00052980 [Dallia pectoralis]|uniref:Uncharacterized protein n=1 Tax=Dallia pectoralis TaxID=75939 RepID=A0ACC2HCC9_DALPE|nr:hypothetical protein DPEC_G00052980 [Dallia pectoralis]
MDRSDQLTVQVNVKYRKLSLKRRRDRQARVQRGLGISLFFYSVLEELPNMSTAKHRMRDKKMRNQPSNITFSTPGQGSSHWRNGGDTLTGRGHGPSPLPSAPGFTHSGHAQGGGWVRGHQRGQRGYAQDLPQHITASMFAKARAAEVTAMLKAVTKTTGSAHVFGALPKHMRRRAMSHNTKRLPCRLRETANKMLLKSQKLGTKEKKEQSKSKSRKARRRHGNMLLEFNRRQRKNLWLETHIWHAKRFHMVKKWGYWLGDRPTLKCYRACYRAMSSHSLLQDLSYYCCVELQGPEEQLLTALSNMTSKDAGNIFAAAMCLSGRRQGSVVLYRAGQDPLQPLGPVSFLWRPRTRNQGSSNQEGRVLMHRQMWIWTHPTMKHDLIPELQAVCQCYEVMEEEILQPENGPASEVLPQAGQASGSKRRRPFGKDVSAGPPAKKMLGFSTRHPSTPLTWRSSTTGIVISDLTMEMVRYRLIGPLSHSVLTEALVPATHSAFPSDEGASSFWWPEHCRNHSNTSLQQQQAGVFNLLKGVYSTAEVPGGSVLGLTVDDPRLTLPDKRRKAEPNVRKQPGTDEERRELMLKGIPEHLSQSSIWDRSVRDAVTLNKLTDQEINSLRNELLVPGSRLPTPQQSRVPVLLVQQPGKIRGTEMGSWGTGWDLLLPKAWGMAFWVPLVYRGVRIGGLKMSLKHAQNKGEPHFPHDYPDCPAGRRFQEEREAELLAKFRRRPPAKRTNYIKNGCLAPFRCPWQQLAEEWEMIGCEGDEFASQTRTPQEQEVTSHLTQPKTPQSFTVLRNRKYLRQLSGWCRPTSSKGQRARNLGSTPSLDAVSVLFLLSSVGDYALVWTRLSLLTKGQPEQHALVCVPTAEDLQLVLKEPGCTGPQEPLHTDHFKTRIKQPRRKANKPGASTSNPDSPQSDPTTTPSILPGPSSTTSALTLGLWPEPLPSVTSHCSRVTLGWVTQGDFSLSTGCGEALGYLSLTGLLHTLLRQPAGQRGLVLIRNPGSLQYRYAKINIET